MAQILFTLTGNLLWEQTLTFDSWSPGATQRARAQSSQVGGKGINVSRMLLRLKTPTIALCFAGGSSGADCVNWMKARPLPHHAFTTTTATRLGTVVRTEHRPETTFLGPDAIPDESAFATCAAYLDGLPDGQVLALCGSFPGWLTPEAKPLRESLARWATRGSLVVDSYGPPLDWATHQPAALVKINRDEFDALTPPAHDVPFAARLQAAVESFSPRAWIVSDGGGPVWLAQRGAAPREFTPPKINLVSATGSGDVLLACVIHAHFHDGLSLANALTFALPYAAANAAHAGVAEFDLNKLPA